MLRCCLSTIWCNSKAGTSCSLIRESRVPTANAEQYLRISSFSIACQSLCTNYTCHPFPDDPFSLMPNLVGTDSASSTKLSPLLQPSVALGGLIKYPSPANSPLDVEWICFLHSQGSKLLVVSFNQKVALFYNHRLELCDWPTTVFTMHEFLHIDLLLSILTNYHEAWKVHLY